MNRVVVTGMGAVTPFGAGVNTLWNSLLENKNGILKMTGKKLTDLAGSFLGLPSEHLKDLLPKKWRSNSAPVAGAINFSEIINKFDDRSGIFSHLSKTDPDSTLFLAVDEAIRKSGIEITEEESSRIGVFIAQKECSRLNQFAQYKPLIQQATVNGKFDERLFYDLLDEEDVDYSDFFHERAGLCHKTSSIYNITGPRLNIGTAALSGANAIGEAFHEIRMNRLKYVIAGGAFYFGLSELATLQNMGILSKNQDPELACRPFDIARSGIVPGSGSGIVILESLENALKRGANILCEITGYATSSGFSHEPEKLKIATIQRNIQECLNGAGLSASDINYVNPCGNSGVEDDRIETMALKQALGENAYRIPISSTKSMIGHSMAAAGAIEAIASIQSIRKGVIHPTRNWNSGDKMLDLDYTSNQSRELKIDHVLSNNSSLNNQNTSLIFSRFTQ